MKDAPNEWIVQLFWPRRHFWNAVLFFASLLHTCHSGVMMRCVKTFIYFNSILCGYISESLSNVGVPTWRWSSELLKNIIMSSFHFMCSVFLWPMCIITFRWYEIEINKSVHRTLDESSLRNGHQILYIVCSSVCVCVREREINHIHSSTHCLVNHSDIFAAIFHLCLCK